MEEDDSQSRSKKTCAVSGRPKILGPVNDLEEHVRDDWWKVIFNSAYLKTDADVVNDRDITSAEVDLVLQNMDLRPESRILDLCCGQGRHAMELARRGMRNIEGIDRSHYLIQKARLQAKKDLLDVRFREGDARKLPYPSDTFDAIIIMGNSFGYFETIREDMLVLKEVFRVMKPWGRLFVDMANGEYLRKNFQPRSWEWIDARRFACRERSLSTDGERLITREIINDVGKGVVSDQFYAVRLYDRKTIEEILDRAGFNDISFSGDISTKSSRNQDLGMMAERMTVTAVVRKKWSAVKRKKESAKEVAVVLGDPSKPDPLKPLCVFDEDDFYTIDRLKGALKELKDYNFRFISSHDSLIHDLAKLKNRVSFVVNLCDEGYDNKARQELHVPALLDMLGLDYTGAGPQCLAFCYDKSLVRGVAKEMGIPAPDAFFIKPEDSTFDLSLSFPVIVKPNLGDSSFGITQKSVANNPDELLNAISEIRDKLGYEKPVLVEELLTGNDITVGIIGNPPESYAVMPVIEEDYSLLPDGLPRICGYEAKWLPNSPYGKIKSVLSTIAPETEKTVVGWCLKLFERLECRDYARFDWRLDKDGNPKLLEVNPNPGWCWDGHLAKMSEFAAISYSEMLHAILTAAEQRIEARSNFDAEGKDENLLKKHV